MAHVDTTLEFSSGVTLISGPNRVGKSCIPRALDWVFYNGGPRWSDEPEKMELLRVGAEEVKVTVTFDDGRECERTRNFKGQTLRLGERVVTSGVNQWPSLITEYVGFEKVKLSSGISNVINIGFQHDTKFGIGWTVDGLDQSLCKLSGAMDIEKGVVLLRKEKKQQRSELGEIEKRVQHHTEQLEVFEPLDEASEIYDESELLTSIGKNLVTDVTMVCIHKNVIDNFDDTISTKTLVNFIDYIKKEINNRELLRISIEDVKALRKNLNLHTTKISLEPIDIKELQELITKVDEVKKLKEDLIKLTKDSELLTMEQEKVNTQVTKYKEELDKRGICLACGQEIPI